MSAVNATVAESLYAALPEDESAQPSKLYPVRVNTFPVNTVFDSERVVIELIVPEPLLASKVIFNTLFNVLTALLTPENGVASPYSIM